MHAPFVALALGTALLVAAPSARAQVPVCGNGLVEPPETCDDGNVLPGDGCSAACLLENLPPDCRAATASADDLWPPNHKLASVEILGVTDRAAIPLVMLRDRHAGPHTPQVAADKAYTSLTFKIGTLQFENVTRTDPTMGGIRQVPRVVAVGGGLPIESAGSQVGAIGVSGAPGGAADEECAKAGIAAIADDLEF